MRSPFLRARGLGEGVEMHGNCIGARRITADGMSGEREGVITGEGGRGEAGKRRARARRLELACEDSLAGKRDVTRNFEIDQACHGSSRGSRKKLSTMGANF